MKIQKFSCTPKFLGCPILPGFDVYPELIGTPEISECPVFDRKHNEKYDYECGHECEYECGHMVKNVVIDMITNVGMYVTTNPPTLWAWMNKRGYGVRKYVVGAGGSPPYGFWKVLGRFRTNSVSLNFYDPGPFQGQILEPWPLSGPTPRTLAPFQSQILEPWHLSGPSPRTLAPFRAKSSNPNPFQGQILEPWPPVRASAMHPPPPTPQELSVM